MFDRKQFRDEIAAQLKDVPREMCVVFAVRSAMRVLPLLAHGKVVSTGQNREAFWYWKAEDRNRHLLAVLRTYSYSFEYILTKKCPTYAAANTAEAAIEAAKATYAAHIAAAAAAAANAAATYSVNAVTYAAAAAAFHAAYDADDAIMQAIHKDLSKLQNITAEALLKQALWSVPPKTWQQLTNDFKQDALSLNAGFEVWTDWYDDRLQGRGIDVELLKRWNNIPKEIEAQGVSKLNAYLKSLLPKTETHSLNDSVTIKGSFGEGKRRTLISGSISIGQRNAQAVSKTISILQGDETVATQPLNRVRAIFIGYGEAGKTSLIRALHDEEVIKGTEKMTAGIDIRDWAVPNTDIQAHFWDFGGQVVFHSTHKFFLRSSCVYIIVINARADINNSEQAEYWLDHVKVFGGSAPVLLVGNKTDEAAIHFEMQTLSQKYPNLKGFYPISCTEAKTGYSHQFDIFKQALTKELQAVGIHQMLFTPAQAKVLDELRQNSLENAFLTEEKFNEICDKHGVSNEGELNRDWLVDIFDKLGVMLHFEELKTFNNAYMLNPRWLTHGVYTLMNAKQARLTDSDMVNILKNTKVEDEFQHLLSYPADKCLFISKAMQRFKLCYPLRNGALLIPALLSNELPSYPPEFQQESRDLGGFQNLLGLNDILRFEFAFSGFLPRNLIGEFMVSRYEEIKDNCQSQRGAVFVSKSCQAQALVEADYHRRLIIMQVCGRDAKEYLAILYDAMLMVFGDLALDYREWVNLPMSACLDKERLRFNSKVEKAPYQQLLAYARKGKSDYVSESGLEYDLMKLLGIIMPDAKIRNITVEGNYIEGDVKEGGNVAGRDANIGNIGEKKVTTTTQNINNSTVHGSVIAAEKIENSFNSLKESKADDAVKTLLEQLLTEIKALNTKVPAAQAQAVENMAKRADTLVTESKSATPDKEWYQLSFKGIKEAALAIGDMAKPVLDVAEKLSPLLLGL